MPNVGPFEIFVVVLWLGVAHVIASRAKDKGYSYGGFFVLALFTWVVAGLILLFLPRRAIGDTVEVAPSAQSGH